MIVNEQPLVSIYFIRNLKHSGEFRLKKLKNKNLLDVIRPVDLKIFLYLKSSLFIDVILPYCNEVNINCSKQYSNNNRTIKTELTASTKSETII